MTASVALSLGLLLGLAARVSALCAMDNCNVTADCNTCGDSINVGHSVFQGLDLFICSGSQCQLSEPKLKALEDSVAVRAACTTRKLGSNTNLCCFEGTGGGTTFMPPEPTGTSICGTKRCRASPSCGPLGTCTFGNLESVDNACCEVATDCPVFNPDLPDPVAGSFREECEIRSCNSANNCVYSNKPLCCTQNSDCPALFPSLQKCEKALCIKESSAASGECRRVPVEDMCGPANNEQCGDDGDCAPPPPGSCSTRRCVAGECVAEPDLLIAGPRPGCCTSDSEAQTECSVLGNCATVAGCRAESFSLGGFTVLPEFTCQYEPKSTTGCCDVDSDCEGISECLTGTCVADFCELSDFFLAERMDSSFVQAPCCISPSDCLSGCTELGLCDARGLPLNRCEFYQCNGPVSGTVAEADAFKCMVKEITAGCTSGSPLAHPGVTIPGGVAEDCSWTCPATGDPNVLSYVTTLSLPSSADRPLFEYQVLVFVTASGGDAAVAAITLEPNGVSSPIFDAVGSLQGGQQIFEPTELSPLFPGDSLPLRAKIFVTGSSPTAQFSVIVRVLPFDTCTQFFVGSTPTCTQQAADAGNVRIPATFQQGPATVFVLDGNSCSQICDGVGPVVPTPPPSAVGGVLLDVAVTARQCQFTCDDPLDPNVNRYGLRITATNPSPLLQSAELETLALVGFDALYNVPSYEAETGIALFEDTSLADWGTAITVPGLPVATALAPEQSEQVDIFIDVSALPIGGVFTVASLYRDVLCTQGAVDASLCAPGEIGTPVNIRVDTPVDLGALGCSLQICPNLVDNLVPKNGTGTDTCDWNCNDADAQDDNFITLEMCYDNPAPAPVLICSWSTAVLFGPDWQILSQPNGAFTLEGGTGTLRMRDLSGNQGTRIATRAEGTGEYLIGNPLQNSDCYVVSPGETFCFEVGFYLTAKIDTTVEFIPTVRCYHPCTSVWPSDTGLCADPELSARFRFRNFFSLIDNRLSLQCPEECESEVPVRRAGSIDGIIWIDEDNDQFFDPSEPRAVGITIDLVFRANNTVYRVSTTDSSGMYSFPVSESEAATGDQIFLRIRQETIPRGFRPAPLSSQAAFDANAIFLRGNNFSPSTGQSIFGVFGLDEYPFLTGAIEPIPPCTRDTGPFPDDGVVLDLIDDECLANGEQLADLDTLCTRQVCGDTMQWRTVRLRHTLSNAADLAAPPSSIELRAVPMHPQSIHCLELVPLEDALVHSEAVHKEPLLAGPGGVGPQASASVSYAYLQGVPPGDDTVVFESALVYCTDNAADTFNVTARVHGDRCTDIVGRWTQCEQGVDFRECYNELEVDPRQLTCPTASPTPAPPVVVPTPPPGSIDNTPFELSVAPTCLTGKFVDRRWLNTSVCTADELAKCTDPAAERGLLYFIFRVINTNDTVASEPVTLRYTAERLTDEEPVCGTLFAFHNFAVNNATGQIGRPEFSIQNDLESVIKAKAFASSLPPGGNLAATLIIPECLLTTSATPVRLTLTVESPSCFVESLCSRQLEYTYPNFEDPCISSQFVVPDNRVLIDGPMDSDAAANPERVRSDFLLILVAIATIIGAVLLICCCRLVLFADVAPSRRPRNRQRRAAQPPPPGTRRRIQVSTQR